MSIFQRTKDSDDIKGVSETIKKNLERDPHFYDPPEEPEAPLVSGDLKEEKIAVSPGFCSWCKEDYERTHYHYRDSAGVLLPNITLGPEKKVVYNYDRKTKTVTKTEPVEESWAPLPVQSDGDPTQFYRLHRAYCARCGEYMTDGRPHQHFIVPPPPNPDIIGKVYH